MCPSKDSTTEPRQLKRFWLSSGAGPSYDGPVIVVRFLLSAALGLSFFLLPLRMEQRFTVPFDWAVRSIIAATPEGVGLYCLVLVWIGAWGSALSRAKSEPLSNFLRSYRTSIPLTLARLTGAPLALVYFFQAGPEILLQPGVGDLMWETLAFSVAVIVPLGAALLVLFVRYGFLDFVGTLMQPVMRPLFRLPGRSALDSLTSWIGSYSVGLYLTSRLLREGLYSKRESYTIATCFSTVSIGFVAVVATTTKLLHLFPLIFITYFLVIYVLTVLLARIWPVTRIPDVYLGMPHPEHREPGNLLAAAWRSALRQAGDAPGFVSTLKQGFLEGLLLASTILGSILSVGTLALLLAKETPVFSVLGLPMVPVLEWLGLPDAEIIAPAVLVGIAEMYIPALLVQEAAAPARFFIAVLSISQLIFFSSVAPMMLDLFREVPIRACELVGLFLLRTAILVPLLAAVTTVLNWAGVFDS